MGDYLFKVNSERTCALEENFINALQENNYFSVDLTYKNYGNEFMTIYCYKEIDGEENYFQIRIDANGPLILECSKESIYFVLINRIGNNIQVYRELKKSWKEECERINK